MLTVAMFFAAGSAFVSCKDYDDDIKNLQSKIDGLQSTINTIQNQITQGYLLTGVTDVTGGVQITLSNGKTYTITNGAQGEKGEKGDKGDKGDTGATGATGAAGKNGTVWTIGEDGYWYKDGEKYTSTAFPEGVSAVGKDGAAGGSGTPGAGGAAGAKGETGNYWMPESDGYFYEYTAAGVKTGKKSDFKWNTGSEGSGTPAVDAAWNSANQTLTLNGLVDANGKTTSVTISLTGDLRSLVFKPNYYFDGIETIIYPWIHDTIMTQPTTPVTQFTRQRANETELKTINLLGLIPTINDENTKTIDWWGNYYTPETAEDRHPYIPTVTTFNQGKEISVNYHLNPANSVVAYGNIAGWSVLTPEVINYHTRAAAATDFSSPEKDFGGNMLFNSANGVLSAGLKIANPQKLNAYPTLDVFNDEDNKANNNTIALQVNTDAGVVTSDYALVYPQKVWVEALAYSKLQNYTEVVRNAQGADTGVRKTHTSNYAHRVDQSTTRKGDLTGALCTEKVHVWDTPLGALKDPDGAALELPFNSDEGLTLRDFLEIHLAVDQVNDMTADKKYPYKKLVLDCSKKEEEKWGLKLSFQLVNYQIAGNISRDSKYAEMANNEDGQIVAWNVDYNASATGTTIKTHSESAIGREPLVQVLVKNEAGDVVLDGYILVRICEVAPEVKDNKDAIYPAQNYTFDLCNDGEVVKTNWDEFSKIVLTDTLKNMTKDQFDQIYQCVKIAGTAENTTADGYKYYEVDQWSEAWADLKKGPKAAATAWPNKIGNIYYYPNWQGTTNHVFKWTIPADELEILTHDKESLPVTVERWVRFEVKYTDPAAALAPYPYVYVKLTAKIDRKKLSDVFGLKNDNYWYDWTTGAIDGWSSTVIDIKEPRDGHEIKVDFAPWKYEFHESLIENLENTSGTPSALDAGNNLHKYYFAPKNETVTGKGPDGKTVTRTITAYHPTEQPNYNKLQCKYSATDIHAWEEAKLNETLQKCAIRYDWGAFTNKNLYSYDGTTYTKIATIDQKTGDITLLTTPAASFEEAKLVLNLVGYESKHANIAKELRTWAAIVSSNECNVAKPVIYDKTPDLFSFQLSWQRPINMQELENKYMLDANTNGNVIYLIDLLKLYDWRGNNSQGKMYDGQYWFWAYYNLEKITIDLTPAKVHTTMHYNDWNKTMADVTSMAELTDLDGGKGLKTYDFSSEIAGKNTAAQEAAIEAAMGINPANNTKKAKFGAIKYVNNGGNVTKFSVRVPIILEYFWGKIYDTIEIEIDSTTGNH